MEGHSGVMAAVGLTVVLPVAKKITPGMKARSFCMRSKMTVMSAATVVSMERIINARTAANQSGTLVINSVRQVTTRDNETYISAVPKIHLTIA